MEMFFNNFKKVVFITLVVVLTVCVFMFPEQRDLVIGAFLVLIAPEMLDNMK